MPHIQSVVVCARSVFLTCRPSLNKKTSFHNSKAELDNLRQARFASNSQQNHGRTDTQTDRRTDIITDDTDRLNTYICLFRLIGPNRLEFCLGRFCGMGRGKLSMSGYVSLAPPSSSCIYRRSVRPSVRQWWRTSRADPQFRKPRDLRDWTGVDCSMPVM